jgi:hypothetical protein
MFLITLLVSLFAFSAPAHSATKGDVLDLLRRIEWEVRQYPQNVDTLARVKDGLQANLDLLRGMPGDEPGNQSCRDFAFGEYRKDGINNSQALERARTYCQRVSDVGAPLDMVSFFHRELLKEGFSYSYCLDQALDLASDLRRGTKACVESSYRKYLDDGYSIGLALKKSVEFCR